MRSVRSDPTPLPPDAVSLSRLAMVVSIIASWAMSQGVTSVALPLYVVSVGRTKSEWGLLAGAYALALMFAEPAWGWLSDRIGVAIPVLASRAVAALLAPMLALTGQFELLFGIQLGRGAFEVVLGPLGRKAMLYTIGRTRRAAGLGLFQATQAVGNGVGLVIGGFVLSLWGYVPAFLAAGVLALAGLGLSLLEYRQLAHMKALPPDPTPPELAGVQPSPPPQPFWGTFSALCLVGVCLYVGMSVNRAFVPLIGTAVANLPAADVSLILSITSVLTGALMIFFGRLSDRWGSKPAILFGLAMTSLGLMTYGVRGDTVGLIVGTVIYAFGIAAGVPATVAWVSHITPPTRQGQMIGLYGAFEDVGLVIGPLLTGFVWDALGPSPALISAGLLAGVGLVAAVWLRGTATRPSVDRPNIGAATSQESAGQ